jgi:hypothetical protein
MTPIPQAVDMSCEIWEHRLKQENPNLGPVTLVYSDGPMFVNPYGRPTPSPGDDATGALSNKRGSYCASSATLGLR